MGGSKVALRNWVWTGLALLIVAIVGLGLWSHKPDSRPAAPPTPRKVLVGPKKAKEPLKKPLKPRRVDSKMTRAQALASNRFPKGVLANMAVLDVDYIGFDGLDHRGQIVVEKTLANEVRAIFAELKKIRYPIKKVVPVVRYGWDDIRSMRDNNTSGFNYRGQVTPNGRSKILSKHALGRAIDLNPYLNPYVSRTGKEMSRYRSSVRGTLTRNSAATRIFLSRGWKWGGNWPGGKDYQHFVKP
jgi:peptidoglycan LD-endopeptidase CwlK